MKAALAFTVLVLTTNAFADGYRTGVLNCKSAHSTFKITYYESEADGFGMGDEDDVFTLNGKTVEAIASFAGDPKEIRDVPTRFTIANPKGQTLIRVASKIPVDQLDTGSKVAVQLNLGRKKITEFAVCEFIE